MVVPALTSRDDGRLSGGFDFDVRGPDGDKKSEQIGS